MGRGELTGHRGVVARGAEAHRVVAVAAQVYDATVGERERVEVSMERAVALCELGP